MIEVDLDAERARVMEKREAEQRYVRGRMALNAVGWKADEVQVRDWARRRWPKADKEFIEEVVEHALKVQATEEENVTRVPVEELKQKGESGPEPHPVLEGRGSQGQRIMEWIQSKLAKDPDVDARVLFEQLPEDIRGRMKYASFRGNYFSPVKSKKRLREGRVELSKPASAPPDPGRGFAPVMDAPDSAAAASEARQLLLVGPVGSFRAEEGAEGRWTLELAIEADREFVDRVAGEVYPLLLGITAPALAAK